MTDLEANKIIFGILLFIIFGILITINTITHIFNVDAWIHRMRNNTGTVSSYNILMWLFVGIAIYLFIYWIFYKRSIKSLLVRSDDN
jgi:hypothetical protein